MKALVAVSCSVLFSLPAFAQMTAPAPTRGASSAAKDANEPGPWASCRGNRAMTGVAGGKLADELKVVWKHKCRGAVVSSPIVVGDRVYVGSLDANMYCLKLPDGAVVWATKTGGGIEAPPIYIDGAIYVGSTDSFLYAFDAGTGKRKWKFETEDKILGSANYVRDPNTGKLRIVVGSYDYSLYGVDPADGKQVWKYTTGNYINGGVAVWNNKSIVGGCDAVIHVVPPNGEDAKTYDAGAYTAATAAVDADGRVYIGNYEGGFICVDLKTGKQAWAYNAEEPFFSSAAIGPDKVVFGGRDTQVHAVDRKTGKQVWAFATKGEVNSSPVICGDKVVVGSGDGRLYMLRLADGKQAWSYDCGSSVSSSPAVVNGMVIVGADNGTVYCFGPK
jgi:outer membrane protein assembly factor BamB